MSQKTWGPFTGAQLTVMSVTLVAVSVPGTLWAVDQFTNVAIMDPVSGRKAAVDTARRLRVGDGVGLLTVDGTVTAREAPYASFFHAYRATYTGIDCVPIGGPPAGKALILKSVVLNTFAASSLGYTVIYSGSSRCERYLASASRDTIGPVSYNLEPGIAIPAGHSVWAQSGNGINTEVFITGYTVPAAQVPTSATIAQTASPHRALGKATDAASAARSSRKASAAR